MDGIRRAFVVIPFHLSQRAHPPTLGPLGSKRMGGEPKKWKLAREGEKKTKTAKEEVEKVKKEAEETFEVG
jgi:hypothetical protein